MSDFETQQKYSICVTTSRAPTSSSSSSSNSEAAQILCPHTGSSSSNFSQNNSGSSLKTGTGVGIQSITRYPCTGNFRYHGLYLAYAGSTNENMQAMLLSSGEGDNPGAGTQKWKCRLPEYMEGGLHISPLSPNFVFAGGRSGRAYVWSTFQNGALLKIWQAHYRPITSISFSSCGGFVLTSGADGIVHLWNILDLVSQCQSDNIMGGDEINPVHTWSEHHLSVSALFSLPSNRAVSVSLDRQLIIMELFNGKTLARILLPSALTSVTSDENAHRLYAGSTNGTIYCIDLDTYAIATTAESATIIAQSSNSKPSQLFSTSGTRLFESVLSGNQTFSENVNNNNDNTSAPVSSYISEFRGHERKVTALTILVGGASMTSSSNDNDDISNDLLVSGGEDGTVRVWDIRARCCTSIMRPWASAPSTTISSKSHQVACPVSSILAIAHVSTSNLSQGSTSMKESDVFEMGMFSTRGQSGFDESSLIRPLQRFQQTILQTEKSQNDEKNDSISIITQSLKNERSIQFWEGDNILSRLSSGSCSAHDENRAKRIRLTCALNSYTGHNTKTESNHHVHAGGDINDHKNSRAINENQSNEAQIQGKDLIIAKSEQELQRLRQELEEATAVIERWQRVNSKLVKKLKKIESKT